MFLTRPPRKRPEGRPVRLACIRHAASVDPEPGSNSPPSSGHTLPGCDHGVTRCVAQVSPAPRDHPRPRRHPVFRAPPAPLEVRPRELVIGAGVCRCRSQKESRPALGRHVWQSRSDPFRILPHKIVNDDLCHDAPPAQAVCDPFVSQPANNSCSPPTCQGAFGRRFRTPYGTFVRNYGPK